MNLVALTFFLVVSRVDLTIQYPTFFRNTFKGLNGLTPSVAANDEMRVVYYYEQTVAVVDLGPNNELHNCDIIEV